MERISKNEQNVMTAQYGIPNMAKQDNITQNKGSYEEMSALSISEYVL